MVEHHPELVQDAEFLLTEGGTIRAGPTGRIEYYGVGTTEKSPFWLEVTARGTAGHRSRPTPDNPLHRLGRALNRIASHQKPPGGAPAGGTHPAACSTPCAQPRARPPAAPAAPAAP